MEALWWVLWVLQQRPKYEKVLFLFLFLNHAMIYDSEFCFKLSSAVYLFHDNEYCTLAMKLNASSLHKIKELYLLTIQIGNSLEQQTMLKPHYATHTSLFHWLVRECFPFSFKKHLLQMFPHFAFVKIHILRQYTRIKKRSYIGQREEETQFWSYCLFLHLNRLTHDFTVFYICMFHRVYVKNICGCVFIMGALFYSSNVK